MQERGQLNIPKVSVEQFPFSTDYQIRLYQQYFPSIEKTEVGQQVVASLSTDPRVVALQGKMVPNGFGWQGFDVKKLAMWYLWCANEYGMQTTKEFLDSFLDSESIPVARVLWVLGMRVANSVAIKGEYIIRPIHDMPDSSQKERFMQNAFPMFPVKSPAPKCAITKACQVKKVAHIPNPSFYEQEARKFGEIDRRLEEIAWLLNALDGVCCAPFVMSSLIEPNVPFGPFGASGTAGRMLDMVGVADTELPDSSGGTINDLLDDYDKLNLQERSRIQRILTRLSQAKRGLQIEDKILDLAIAMEMLLLQDNREQLALAFRLRGSRILGSSPEERKEIYDRLKEVYTYRSEVAHSGVLCKDSPAEKNKISSRFPTYQSLAERIVRKIIKDGKPDWDRLVIGGV